MNERERYTAQVDGRQLMSKGTQFAPSGAQFIASTDKSLASG
ncbi:hypothetical protein [Enterovirga aerilata]|nr:hypothetical protein [Enterovirga sp. DB1703]